MINVNEAFVRIKKAGSNNVRVIPMPGQDALNGLYQIEINESNNWSVIATGMPRSTADDLVKKATSRVICG